MPEERPDYKDDFAFGRSAYGKTWYNGGQSSEILVIGISASFWGVSDTVTHNDISANVTQKHVNVIVLPTEMEFFAYKLVDDRFFYTQISFSFPENEQDIIKLMHKLFGSAGQAASIGGLVIQDGMALCSDEATAQRAAWLPLIYTTLSARMSSLGNAPHDAWIGARHALMNSVTLYARPRYDMLKGLYKGKSAICIASGPSLADHLEHIRSIQSEHIIIATDSVYRGLIDQGIFPDFVTVVERTDDMHKLFDGTEWRSETTWCVALPLVHPRTLESFRHRVIWWWNKDALYPWVDSQLESTYSGRSAGTLTVALAGWLGVETAYLVGHDLSYASDGTTHSPTVAEFTKSETKAYEKNVDEQNAQEQLAPAFRHQQHRIPGNAGDEVLTNGTWLMFKSDIEALIPIFPDTRFLNTNGLRGAKINGVSCLGMPPSTGNALPRIGRHQKVSDMRWRVFRDKVSKLFGDLVHFSKAATQTLQWLSSLSVESLDEQTMAQVAERTTILSLLGPERSSSIVGNIYFFNFIFCPTFNCYLLECHKQAKNSVHTIERRYKMVRESIRLMQIFASLSMQYASEVNAIVDEYFNKPTAHMQAIKERQETAQGAAQEEKK